MTDSHKTRVPLAHLPTPVYELLRLGRALGGPRLLVKRDDLTGLAAGGNKARKLEFLIADALAQGADTVITAGAVQSNHACQTAAAAARYGLGCILVLNPMAPASTTGNLLLDRLFGARVRWTGDRDGYDLMQEVAAEERAAGHKPYVIPVGGSNAIGAAGYYYAMDELVRQCLQSGTHIDHIVLASGSAGTQAGLVVGAHALHVESQIVGISVSRPAAELGEAISILAQRTAAHLNLRLTIDPATILVDDSYLGGGYGVLGEAEQEAIRLVARHEGLLLDPVYTGRAMAGLIARIRQREYRQEETVLFWHTGGTPALFAHAHALARDA